MSHLAGRHILLGVSGSVAAFKAAALASELTKAGADVRVILTAAGERFVTVETFRDLTNQPVATSLWDAEIDHIDLARWADIVVVAPATANLIARTAIGLAEDLLGAVLLASSIPVVFAPAMETHMWTHAATKRNVDQLRERGIRFVGPVSGRLASGEAGAGRMAEPLEIVRQIGAALTGEQYGSMRGVTVLISAGPTQEPIDPVRFISNRSSGKMGYALASEASQRGADVVLISGPVDPSIRLSLPSHVEIFDVQTAAEMRDAVLERAANADVVIMAAAVADYRPVQPASQKLKKKAESTTISLEPTEDILALLAENAPHTLRVGFAAETNNLVQHAEEKLERKRLAMVVANDVSGGEGPVFGSDENRIVLIRPGVDPVWLDRMPKSAVAVKIVEALLLLVRAAGEPGGGS